MSRKNIIIASFVLVSLTVSGVLIYNYFFAPKKDQDTFVQKTQELVSTISNFNTDSNQNLKLNLPNKSLEPSTPISDLEVFYTQKVSSSKVILEIPLNNIQDQAYANLNKDLNLVKFKQDNPDFDSISILFDPSSTKLSFPAESVSKLHFINIEGVSKAVFLQNLKLFIADQDFTNKKEVLIGSTDNPAQVFRYISTSFEQPVIWINFSFSPFLSQDNTDFNLQWYKFSLKNFLDSGSGLLARVRIRDMESEIKSIDLNLETSNKLVKEVSGVTSKVTGEQSDLEYNLPILVDSFALKNEKMFFASSYFTSNFWLAGNRDFAYGPIQIQEVKFTNDEIYTTCVSSENICFSYDPKANQLIKFDLNKDQVNLEKGSPNLDGKKFDEAQIGKSLLALGYDRSRLLRYDSANRELGFWYIDKWVILGKN